MQSQEKIDIKNHINTNSKTNSYAQGQYKLTCPSCGSSRKKKRDTPLSVNINAETIVYHCHHCGINGAIARNQGVKMAIVKTEPTPVKKKPINLPTPDKQAETWLLERGISIETANASGCVLGKKNNKPVIGFSFTEGDETVAVKWRSANGTKDFWWDNNATRLWGLQNHDEKLPTIEKTLVITEGELDCLAIKEAFKDHSNIDVYSVPNGAPNKITDIVDPKEDKRFKYVWDDREKFEGVDRIILATDTDTNGQLLADELARRLNKARCYTVDYLGSKDANDLLVKTDAETVRKQILNAEPVPLHGLNNIEHYADEFQSLYEQGKPRGVSTGFDSVDELFTLQTGYLNIVTGYPGDGKSAFIDQIVVNVAKNYGWKTCFCSFEKPPTLHSVQLAQVLVGKPFFEGQNERMTPRRKRLC
jgi:twinkle protein